MEVADTEVADTEAAVTLVAVISVAVTLAAVTSPAVTSAEAAPVCTLAGLMCTLAEIAVVGLSTEVAAAGLAGGVMADGVMVDPMLPPATRTEEFIRTATGRNELKPMGVLHVHWRRTKARGCSSPSLGTVGPSTSLPTLPTTGTSP
jgi:hypothetical protein